jgi:hypothetical protein
MTDKLITRNKAQRGVDQLEAELAELEKNLIPPQTEPEDAPTSPKPADNEPVTREDGEPLNKEEETFKERYSNLRRYAQKSLKESFPLSNPLTLQQRKKLKLGLKTIPRQQLLFGPLQLSKLRRSLQELTKDLPNSKS